MQVFFGAAKRHGWHHQQWLLSRAPFRNGNDRSTPHKLVK